MDAGWTHFYTSGLLAINAVKIMNDFSQDSDTGYWYTFYPNDESYRSRGQHTPLPEFAVALDPTVKVIGGRVQEDSYHNGREWLNAVFNTGAGVTGFVHAEDHYWDGSSWNGNGKAYKSVSLGKIFDSLMHI